MALHIELGAIDGAQQLFDWFGYWPSFHDGEVISLCLNRLGASSLKVHTWEITNEQNKQGYYILAKHITVEFILEGISDLELSDFSKQNIVAGIDIDKTDEGFALTLAPCAGLAGTIMAARISIHIRPYSFTNPD